MPLGSFTPLLVPDRNGIAPEFGAIFFLNLRSSCPRTAATHQEWHLLPTWRNLHVLIASSSLGIVSPLPRTLKELYKVVRVAVLLHLGPLGVCFSERCASGRVLGINQMFAFEHHCVPSACSSCARSVATSAGLQPQSFGTGRIPRNRSASSSCALDNLGRCASSRKKHATRLASPPAPRSPRRCALTASHARPARSVLPETGSGNEDVNANPTALPGASSLSNRSQRQADQRPRMPLPRPRMPPLTHGGLQRVVAEAACGHGHARKPPMSCRAA